jgi:hypothetical protein
MSGNPKGSPWRNTPRTARKRRPIEITLSDEARGRLDQLAEGSNRSRVIEWLLLGAFCATDRAERPSAQGKDGRRRSIQVLSAGRLNRGKKRGSGRSAQVSAQGNKTWG